MSLKVLVADDDPNVHEILRIYFEQQNIEMVEAYDGKEAIELTSKVSPDMIILDVMMPEMDGYDACREINKTSSIPIIMLTSKREEFDCVLGLELGADDYITKPFSPRVVMSKIKAIFRRVHAKPEKERKNQVTEKVYDFKDLQIYMERREVMVHGESVFFSPKEFDLLAYMVKRPGAVYTREHLLEHVWGYDFFGDARTVDVHVKKIRRKLNDLHKNCIHTVWSVGYKFEV